MTQLIRNWFTDLWDWIDNRGVVRRLMVLGTFLLNGHFVLWAMKFSETSGRVGADIALIIGAIGVPMSALAGVMFNTYSASRKE